MPHTTIILVKVKLRLISIKNYNSLNFNRWRIESAATRDHTIYSPGIYINIINDADVWHETLCQGFIIEYKRYLQTLGFMPLQIENPYKKQEYVPQTFEKHLFKNIYFQN